MNPNALGALAVAGLCMGGVGAMIRDLSHNPRVKYYGGVLVVIGLVHTLPGLTYLWIKAIGG